MDEQKLSEYVVNQLAQEIDKQDVIYGVCQQSEMNWPEAQDFVNRVEILKEAKIIKRRAPLLIILCLIVIIQGGVQSIIAVPPVLDNIRHISTITAGFGLLRALLDVGYSLPYFLLGLIILSSGIIGLYAVMTTKA